MTTMTGFAYYDEDKALCLKSPDVKVCSRAIAETSGWFSDTVILYEARAKAYLSNSDYKNAIADYSAFLTLAPRNQHMDLFVRGRVLRGRAQAYRATKQFDLAIEDYLELLKIHAASSNDLYDSDKVFLCTIRAESERELPAALATSAACRTSDAVAAPTDRCTDEALKQSADLATFSKMTDINNCTTAAERANYDSKVKQLIGLTEKHSLLLSICPESNWRWQYARDTFEIQSRVFRRVSKGCEN